MYASMSDVRGAPDQKTRQDLRCPSDTRPSRPNKPPIVNSNTMKLRSGIGVITTYRSMTRHPPSMPTAIDIDLLSWHLPTAVRCVVPGITHNSPREPGRSLSSLLFTHHNNAYTTHHTLDHHVSQCCALVTRPGRSLGSPIILSTMGKHLLRHS
jgi:hypothetical protein